MFTPLDASLLRGLDRLNANASEESYNSVLVRMTDQPACEPTTEPASQPFNRSVNLPLSQNASHSSN